MSFRNILAPIFRIFQWSGLSPLSLIAKKSRFSWRNETFKFVVVTVALLLINFGASIYILATLKPRPVLYWYQRMLVLLSLRIHAITVLIESFAKKSIQSELFATFDEIEKIFGSRLHLKTDNHRLRLRFRRFIIIWIFGNVTFLALSLIDIASIPFKWYNLYYLVVLCLPFCTSTLSYVQWMVCVDAIRFNIERVNECLVGDNKRTVKFRTNRHIFCPEALSIDTYDACKRLEQLRICLAKMWLASIQINDCFRWALLVGSGISLLCLVVNLHWILLSLVAQALFSWYDIGLCAFWACQIWSNFLIISLICEDINSKVRFVLFNHSHFSYE